MFLCLFLCRLRVLSYLVLRDTIIYTFGWVYFVEHVAILAKKRKLLAKILSGEKTIESRWYVSKTAPWDRIRAGEIVYFKESGDSVSIKAEVAKVLQFYLPDTDVSKLLGDYGKDIAIPKNEFAWWVEWCKQRKYCILIFLKNVEQIEPFDIDKSGFGLMSAWICVGDVKSIRK